MLKISSNKWFVSITYWLNNLSTSKSNENYSNILVSCLHLGDLYLKKKKYFLAFEYYTWANNLLLSVLSNITQDDNIKINNNYMYLHTIHRRLKNIFKNCNEEIQYYKELFNNEDKIKQIEREYLESINENTNELIYINKNCSTCKNNNCKTIKDEEDENYYCAFCYFCYYTEQENIISDTVVEDKQIQEINKEFTRYDIPSLLSFRSNNTFLVNYQNLQKYPFLLKNWKK